LEKDLTGRLIVLDTETTGFDYNSDRITEIGAIEIVNFKPTGRVYHCYIQSGKAIPAKVVELTGITNDFLKNKPVFKQVAKNFVDFVGDATLVAHNAPFDCNFINAELRRIGLSEIPLDRYIDTLQMAREKFAGKRASLDALCKKFDIPTDDRQFHGAIVDAKLLVSVLKAMCETKADLFSEQSSKPIETANEGTRVCVIARKNPYKVNESERLAHREFMQRIEEESNKLSMWSRLKAI